MIRALNIAATGMLAQQANIEIISHNLANVNTNGYKKERAEFQDVLYTRVRTPVPGQAGALSIGQGTRLSHIQRIFSNGSLLGTGNPLDLAIQGNGFFRIQQTDGSIGYAREGAFRLDKDGRLMAETGNLVLGRKGPITIPTTATNIEIRTDGTVRYTDQIRMDDPTKEAQVELDQIQLAMIPRPGSMVPVGENLWSVTAESGDPVVRAPGEEGTGSLAQGYVETANVQAVEEMTNLLLAQRVYSMNSRVVQAADEMMSMANNVRRG